MSEVLRVKIFDTDQEIEIIDPEPIASAVKFKGVSDAIWAQKPESKRLASHTIPSVIEPRVVRDELNNILKEVDGALVISGLGKALDLGQASHRNESVTIDAATMDNPTNAGFTTFNWDANNDHRVVDLDGELTVVEFLDDHKDYHRELDIRFKLGKSSIATYGMQRMQSYQAQTTRIYLNVWHSDFAEMGYEGHPIARAVVSEQQEDRILNLIQSAAELKI